MHPGRAAVYPCLALVVVGTGLWLRSHKAYEAESIKNFQPKYNPPAGWVLKPHGMTEMFKYGYGRTGLILRGAVNQVVSEINPTPELDTKTIGQFYIDRTHESMPEWTATDLGLYKAGRAEFEVIRRATKDRVVVTAYVVKGNTTFIVSLFGQERAKGLVDANMQQFYNFLNGVSLQEKDLSAL